MFSKTTSFIFIDNISPLSQDQEVLPSFRDLGSLGAKIKVQYFSFFFLNERAYFLFSRGGFTFAGLGPKIPIFLLRDLYSCFSPFPARHLLQDLFYLSAPRNSASSSSCLAASLSARSSRLLCFNSPVFDATD